ncbi:MAG: PD-(D/E)XK nuclease domain-containing protein, partial [Oscillospiraceae bacterium]|nr:PD-(D/E)XK nuclease domain-containing protein [Oscillospiraceae bacterium]
FYHGTVFGMLAVMSDSYYITSNREAGEGRFDVQLEPKDKKQAGYILEFKTKKDLNEDGMKALAEEGIRQIRDHRYYTDIVPTQNKCQKPGSSRDEDGQRGKSWETPINQGKTRVFEARTTRPLTNKMRINRFFAASARKTQKTAGKS